jgi:hypothetical protein
MKYIHAVLMLIAVSVILMTSAACYDSGRHHPTPVQNINREVIILVPSTSSQTLEKDKAVKPSAVEGRP